MANVKHYCTALYRFLRRQPLAREMHRRLQGATTRVPVTWPSPASAGQPQPAPLLSTHHQTPPRFVLYRIIGNDLVPRHAPGQSRNNLAFILNHEPPLPGCEKRYIVNRIIDPAEEQAIIALLQAANAPYLHIPFDATAYQQCGWDIESIPQGYRPHQRAYHGLLPSEQERIQLQLYAHKNRYVMNNNGARNAALKDGQGRGDWVLPWDGNCFITPQAWEDITRAVQQQPETAYFITPMARVTSNDCLLEQGYRPAAMEEPQIIFRHDAQERFNPAYVYGRRPKVELLWRLAVEGPWQQWPIEPWDIPPRPLSSQAGQWAYAGWVARLFSGQKQQEDPQHGLGQRGVARHNAIISLLDTLDQRIATPYCCPQPTAPAQAAQWHRHLSEKTAEAQARGPFSVTQKTTLPPSKNKHDYWHPAPYYWPTLPGLPYLPRDGKRVPGTRMYEPQSERYDRTRLQRLFDDVYILALASSLHNNSAAAHHAATLIDAWFVDPQTAMTPHMQYAQVKPGWHRNQGSSAGIIEAKDMYFFLDAVTWLTHQGVLKEHSLNVFKMWLSRYLDWLTTSPQGQKERRAKNNHGTYYDLQVLAIASYLEDQPRIQSTLKDSHARLLEQITPEGQQPEELKRTTSAHYCCFNLQGWVHLAELAQRHGQNLWHHTGSQGQGIQKALEWLLGHDPEKWPYPQINAFDSQRFQPLTCAYQRHYLRAPVSELANTYEATKPVFHPHDGIRPFWQMAALQPAQESHTAC